MHSPILILLLLLSAASAKSLESNSSAFNEVCYPGLGCFRSDGNFFDLRNRPITVLPESPEAINTRFFLFTRSNRGKAQEIRFNVDNSVTKSNFNGNRLTKIIIHGFRDNSNSGWMGRMKDALLNVDDFNVILVDWSDANGFPYTQATANTRVVGAVTARLIQWLESKYRLSRVRCHLIGHSLGSHIAGYAGERLSGNVARITGMDPAGPYFEYMHPQVRLDPTDARFVDAIHTDGSPTISIIQLKGGFGMMQAIGHVDFYPNGGKYQTPCLGKDAAEQEMGSVSSMSCHHGIAIDYTIASIQNMNRNYRAVPCSSYENFKAGKCSCGSIGCASMGYKAEQWDRKGRHHVKMFLDTSDRPPFEV